jgi:hypothetical protein
LLAKNCRTTRSYRQHALSLKSFVGTPPRADHRPLAPTGEPSTAINQSHRIIALRAVGARLAREQSTAAYLPLRVIVLRGRASLLRANNPPRFTCPTASSFFTGEQSTAAYLPHSVIVLRGRVHPITTASLASRLLEDRNSRSIPPTTAPHPETRCHRQAPYHPDHSGSSTPPPLSPAPWKWLCRVDQPWSYPQYRNGEGPAAIERPDPANFNQAG